MGRWASRRRTQTLLIAAIAVAAIGAELRWQDPMPTLVATARRPRSGSLEAPRPPAAGAPEPGLDPSPAQDLPLAEEPSPEEDLRDAVAEPRPGLKSMDWTEAASRGAGRREPAAKTLERFRAAPAPRAFPSRVGKEKSGRETKASPGRSEAPKRAGPAAFFPAPSWRGWPRRGEPPPLSQQLRREEQLLRAARQRPSRSAREEAAASAGRGGASYRGHAASASESGGKKEKEEAAGKEEKAKRPRKPKFHPALLSALLGGKPLRPPQSRAAPPKGNPWTLPIPGTFEDGAPLVAVGQTLADVEKDSPPDRLDAACREKGPHWHAEGDARYYHDGTNWGRSEDGRWSWLERGHGSWWIWADQDSPPMLWHQDHWWYQSSGVWFLLHDGEPWGYRFFAEFKQEGFIHPESGTKMLYSADGSRVGLVSPGEGETVFDAASGEELGRVSEDRLPKRPQPRASRTLDDLKSRASKWYP